MRVSRVSGAHSGHVSRRIMLLAESTSVKRSEAVGETQSSLSVRAGEGNGATYCKLVKGGGPTGEQLAGQTARERGKRENVKRLFTH